MSASIVTPATRTGAVLNMTAPDELEELETSPMTDHEHLAAFGWAWDDPNAVEASA